MKKRYIVLIIILAIICFTLYGILKNQSSNNKSLSVQDKNITFEINDSTSQDQENIVETTSGIVYTAKVVAKESRYYFKDQSKDFNKLYVEVNQNINKGDVLFDYVKDSTIDVQIEILNKSFVTLNNQLNDLNANLNQLNTWLNETSDEGYIAYLKSEINKVEISIAQNKIEILTNQEKIKKLQKQKEDYSVKSQIDGFVYSINEDNSSSNTSTPQAFITIFSNVKKVRISVSELEYRQIKVGDSVLVKVESMNKEFYSNITYIDSLPNNMDSNQMSNYNVDIEINEDIPYGYSATVVVNVDE